MSECLIATSAAVAVVTVVGVVVWRMRSAMRAPLSRQATADNPLCIGDEDAGVDGASAAPTTTTTTHDPRIRGYDAYLKRSVQALRRVRARRAPPRAFALPSLAVPFDRAAADLLVPGGGERGLRSGVVRCGDGSAYVACQVDMPHVTGAMIQWWFAWCDRSTKYRLWHPEDHVWCTWSDGYFRVPAADRRPGHERGQSHIVIEHLGKTWGGPPEDLHIDFVDPATWGFTQAACAAARVTAVTCMRVNAYREPGLGHLAVGYVVHCARVLEGGGVRLRSRFWLGKDVAILGRAVLLPHCIARRLVRVPAVVRATLPLSRCVAVWRHATEEFTVLSEVLPDLFQAEAGAVWKAVAADGAAAVA